jgi:hypothetical protein
MGKIFLYAAANSENYSNTRAILEKRLTCEQVINLSTGNFFGSEASQQLRSGDIVILYANTSEELGALRSQATDFADYNLILILEQTITSPYKDALQLVPRYINLGLPNIPEIRDIIMKITKKGCRHTQYSPS